MFTAIFFAKSEYVGEYIWTYLLSGGLLFGACFMATDYATSPKGLLAVCIYGIGLGFLTVVFRKFGSMNGGVSFAILLMNIVTPLLEKITPRIFGVKSKWITNCQKIKGFFQKIGKKKSEEKEAQNG